MIDVPGPVLQTEPITEADYYAATGLGAPEMGGYRCVRCFLNYTTFNEAATCTHRRQADGDSEIAQRRWRAYKIDLYVFEKRYKDTGRDAAPALRMLLDAYWCEPQFEPPFPMAVEGQR